MAAAAAGAAVAGAALNARAPRRRPAQGAAQRSAAAPQRARRGSCAAFALLLAVACGAEPGLDASEPFHPPAGALAGSALDAAHFRGAAAQSLELLVDQGLRGVADVSDLYRERTSGALVSGNSAAVRDRLEAALAHTGPDAQRRWRAHAAAFPALPAARALAENIHSEPSPQLRLPALVQRDALNSTAGPVLDELARRIELRGGEAPLRLPTQGGAWLQDYWIPFEDGTLGVPPHFDAIAFQRAVAAARQIGERFETGGRALVFGPASETPLRALRAQGARFRVLRAPLEGGNVLSVRDRDGAAWLLLGRHSLDLTMGTYGLDEARARELVAADFALPSDHVLVLPQPGYHIDLHLRAARPGELLLADPALGLQTLESILLARAAGAPAPAERAALEALLARAIDAQRSVAGQRLAHALARTRAVAEARGFTATAYPSLYLSYLDTGEYERRERRLIPRADARHYLHINALNSRYWTSPEGRVISFALASGYPALDRALEDYERRAGADEVFLLGRRLAAPRFWGHPLLVSAGGVGCLSNY